MRFWKIALSILLMLIMATGCGSGSKTQTSVASGDVGEDSPLEWPSELMGSYLTSPNGIITSIDQGSTFFGEGAPDYITVVSLKGMSRTDCEDYKTKLKSLGFVDDPTEKDANGEFLYCGSMNSEESGVTFQYNLDEGSGFVSYNPMLTDDFIDIWPAENMGNIPDPGGKLISFEFAIDDGNTIYTVDFANISEQNASEYVAELRRLGYTPETDTSDGEIIVFKGYDSNGNGVAFNYSVIYENGTITYGKDI
jgi:hypothetical protein